MDRTGTMSCTGELSVRKLIGGSLSFVPPRELGILLLMWHGLPRPGLSWEVFAWRLRNVPNFMRGFWRVAAARILGIPHFMGRLSLVVLRGDGRQVDLGLASLRVVTTAGVNFIVDAFQNLTEVELFKFHGLGTGTGAEAVGDTALGTELTTEYTSDNVRPTGSQTEGAANVYRTVATITIDSGTPAITEHAVLTQAATGGGTCLDRSKFAAINLVGANGDGIQATYDFTVNSGG